MNERLKILRKTLKLTQQEFADKIHVSRGALAVYEVGRNQPIDAVVALICREFNVNEQWLRTGQGEMFVPQSGEDELAAAVERLMGGISPEFKRRLVVALSTLNDEHWLLLEEKLREILGVSAAEPPGQEPEAGDPEYAQWEREADELAADVREQYLQEKIAEAESSASRPGTGGEKMA